MKIENKPRYVCEVCGREYDTEADARACEKKCVFANKKEERYKKLRYDVEQYNRDYPEDSVIISRHTRTLTNREPAFTNSLDDLFRHLMGA